MSNTTIEPTSSASGHAADQRADSAARPRFRRFTHLGAIAAAGALALTLAACGGDDEPTATTVPTTEPALVSEPTSPTVALPTTPTTAPPTTAPEIVTAGATVVVANASRVDGGAGRLSDRLALAQFTVGTPTDSSEGPLEVSKVYYNASVDGAQAVAESVRLTLGGGAIELLELPTPPPVGSGDIGDATVLVAMGNDIADTPLDVLQGIATTTTVSSDTTTETTTEETTATTTA